MFFECNEAAGNQIFFLSKENEIRNYDVCLDAASNNGTVKTLHCHNMGGNQKWEYDEQVSLIPVNL